VVEAFIGTLLPNRDDTQEVLQRVAVTLVRKFDVYNAALPFAAWAIGIAKVEIKAFRREQASSKGHVVDDELLDQAADSFERLSKHENALPEALDRCLKRLDAKARRLIEMRYVEAARPNEIAAILGTSSGAVRTALSKIRAALRNCVYRQLRMQGRPA
jgi:RNA polymerase sigma-70 factor (ECF subfamily)